MKKIVLICFLFLFGCKTNSASEEISKMVINDLNTHNETIKLLEKQTKEECKTDAFYANINSLKTQVESIVGQVKSISKSCDTEKKEIKNRIYIRNCIILIFLIFLVISIYFNVKK